MQQPVQPAPSPVALETHPLNLASPVPSADPMARKQVVQDLMAQMQGTYNFMQVRTLCLEQMFTVDITPGAHHFSALRTQCWSLTDSQSILPLSQRSL